MLELFALFASSRKTRKLENAKIAITQIIGSKLGVSEHLTFDVKITSMRIAWLDDSAKISCRELVFYSIF